MATSKTAAKAKAKKKVKKNVSAGIAHIQSTFNNTVVTITDINGNAVAWSCGRRAWLQGPRNDPFAAQLAAEEARVVPGARDASVAVFVKAPAPARERRAPCRPPLQGHRHPRRAGHPPHGCRPPKRRRV